MTEETYQEYMLRLENEMDHFRRDMFAKSPSAVYDEAQHIINMTYAYNYLHSKEIPDDELEYVMKAKRPLHEIACTRAAFDSVKYHENPIALTVFDICDKRLFDEADVEKTTDRIPIRFHRKVSNRSEIEGFSRYGEDDRFDVRMTVELSTTDFDRYSRELLYDQPFISDNKDQMWIDHDGCYHCILVHDSENNRGFLVESEGYDYARYIAYVQDTRELYLQNISGKEFAYPDKPKRARNPKQSER